MNSPDLISVLIPARNEETWIGHCLKELHAGTTPRDRYEVILIDNGSTDRTVEIATPLVDKVLEITGGNISKLRNQAVAASSGGIIAYLDADCIPAADWLEAGLESLGEERCITGATYLLPAEPARAEALWFSLEPKPTEREEARFVPAGNLFIRRGLFDEMGGFDETLEAGEDKELCARVARVGKVYHDPALRVVHEGNPKTFVDIFKRERWHGRGILTTMRTNPSDKLVLATLLVVASVVALVVAPLLAFFLPMVGAVLAVAGLCGIGAVIGMMILRHRRRLKGIGHALSVGWIYLFYFAGRVVAFFSSLMSIPYYHHLTASKAEAG